MGVTSCMGICSKSENELKYQLSPSNNEDNNNINENTIL